MERVTNLVTSIIEMDKEIERLRVENNLLKLRSENKPEAIPFYPEHKEEKMSVLYELALTEGQKALYHKIFYYSFYSVCAERNKDNEVVYDDFYKWAKKCIRNNDDTVPFTVSPAEIIKFFDKELRIKYQELCESAYERLIESEKEKDDE